MTETKPTESKPAAAPFSVVLDADLFACVDNKTYPETIPAGSTVTGDLAETAISLGKAVDPRQKKSAQNKAAPGAPETKG